MNNDSTLTSDLANNLNYDYVSVNSENASSADRYSYRIQQTTTSVLNTTVPQLIISLWSGEYLILISIVKRC